MSNLLTEVEEGKLYSGYDTLAAIQFCTPSVLGCSACIGASVVDGYVSLNVSVNTPFGNVSKTFKITNNISFTWQPFSRFKVTITVTNFSSQGNNFNFDAGIQVCIQVPFVGWKCASYSHHFSIPTLVAGDAQKELDDYQVAALLSAHAHDTGCKDCGDDSKSKFLQGDIYSGYLNQQAGAQGSFPTLPVISCVVTCTGISPICLAGADKGAAVQAGAQGSFPTLPVISCVVTCTGISPICLAGADKGAAVQAGAQGSFPTLPVISCVVTCTGVSPICLAGADKAAGAVVAETPHTVAFPTIPAISCIPELCHLPRTAIPVFCPTQIPPICFGGGGSHGLQAQAAGQPAFPTIPVVSCVTICTGIPPIC